MSSNPRSSRLARVVALALILFARIEAMAQDAEAASAARLAWSEVEGARSYEVLVRPAGEGAEFFRATVETTEVEAALPAGEWEIRVRALNVFGKIISEGAWTAFSIRRTALIETPVLETGGVSDDASAPSLTLSVRAEGILDETSAFLEGPGGSFPASRIETERGRLVAVFSLEAIPEGGYDLVLENPGDIAVRLADAYERVLPPSEEVPPPVSPPEPGAAATPPAEAAPEPSLGDKPAIEASEPATALAASAPYLPETESGAATAEPKGGPLFDVIASSAWYPALLVSEAWSIGYADSWAALEFSLSLSLAERASSSAFLRAISLELSMEGTWVPGKTGDVVDAARLLVAGFAGRIGLDWRPFLPLGLSLRGGGGWAASLLDRSGEVGEFSARSGDYFITAGAGVFWDFGGLRLELGVDFQRLLYLELPLDLLRPRRALELEL